MPAISTVVSPLRGFYRKGARGDVEGKGGKGVKGGRVTNKAW